MYPYYSMVSQYTMNATKTVVDVKLKVGPPPTKLPIFLRTIIIMHWKNNRNKKVLTFSSVNYKNFFLINKLILVNSTFNKQVYFCAMERTILRPFLCSMQKKSETKGRGWAWSSLMLVKAEPGIFVGESSYNANIFIKTTSTYIYIHTRAFLLYLHTYISTHFFIW